MRKKLSGWKKISGCVFERDTGARIHLLGTIKIGQMFFEVHQRALFPRYIKQLHISGFNVRRAMMAIAEDLQTPSENLEPNKQGGGA